MSKAYSYPSDDDLACIALIEERCASDGLRETLSESHAHQLPPPPFQPSTEEKSQRDFERGRSLALSGRTSKRRRMPSPVMWKIGNIQSPHGFCTHCNKRLTKRIQAKNDAIATITEYYYQENSPASQDENNEHQHHEALNPNHFTTI